MNFWLTAVRQNLSKFWGFSPAKFFWGRKLKFRNVGPGVQAVRPQVTKQSTRRLAAITFRQASGYLRSFHQMAPTVYTVAHIRFQPNARWRVWENFTFYLYSKQEEKSRGFAAKRTRHRSRRVNIGFIRLVWYSAITQSRPVRRITAAYNVR